MKDKFLLKIIKEAHPEYDPDDVVTTGFIDTGSYALNALVSASIYKGIPNNRVTAFAGEESTGKTYLALSMAKGFQDNTVNVDGGVMYFDSEFALEKAMLERRGLDTERVYILKPETLQDFKNTATQILENYINADEKKRPPLMMILDSLGNLPTNKEVQDAIEGKDTRDMTRAQIIRSIFRTITQRLGKVGVPLILTNHVYATLDMYSKPEISGGGGLKYAASTIVTLSKSKDRDKDKNVVGLILKAYSHKSRYSKEHQQVEIKLHFDTGLDRYYGLIDVAERAGIFVKSGNKFELPGGVKVFESVINRDPEKYFTKDVLDQIDVACQKMFAVGIGGDATPSSPDETDDDE